jgi:hypothetical protein
MALWISCPSLCPAPPHSSVYQTRVPPHARIMAGSRSPGGIAERACLTCRKQKRKCSRDLPVCTLCQRHRRTCDYPTDCSDPAGSAAPASHGHHQAASMIPGPVHGPSPESFETGPRTNSSQAIFFLDSYTFKRRAHTLRQPVAPLPFEFLDQIRDPTVGQHFADLYFIAIHTSFPIGKALFPPPNKDYIRSLPCSGLPAR